MSTTPYSLKSDYTVSTPVSASDLNRRARVLANQLPGALRAAALGAGVLPLWAATAGQSLPSLIADLATHAQGSLKVSKVGSLFVATAGAAVIEATSFPGSAPLIYTQTATSLQTPAQNPVGNQTLYIHLVLQVPADPSAFGAPDSALGDAPFLRVTDLESEPNSLLLASLSDADGLLDRRTFAASALLAQEMDALRQRLDALSDVAPDEDGDGVITPAAFKDLQLKVQGLEGSIADLKAQIAKLTAGINAFPAPFDILADEIALNRSGLAEVNIHAIERGQISVVTRGTGKGQDDTPDFAPNSPTINDPLELPWDTVEGVFGP